ncbi:MAG: site-2 protease family protein [Desulfurococcales archaeon]|nr:site-2 protease family protein [Desulfurococcales archaeon]
MADNSLLLFISGLLAFWTVVYALGKGKGGDKLEVMPGALLVRAGVRLDPMEAGAKRKLLIVFGYISVALLIISAALFYYYVGYVFALKYIIKPPGEEVQGFSPIIPGVTIGWKDTIYIMVAIGVAAFFHELSHALVSRAVGVKVKDAGIALFLFIPAAFVEPDEDELKRARLRDRTLIYSAGVGANVILALLSLIALSLAAQSLAMGVMIVDVSQGSPAEQAGLQPGMVIVAVNGEPVKSLNDLINALKKAGVGDRSRAADVYLKVVVDGEEKTVHVHKPVGVDKIGVTLKEIYKYNWLVVFIRASYIINFSLALVNAAPLAIPLPGGVLFADGGQILRDIVAAKYGEEKGNLAAVLVGVATLAVLISLMGLARLQIS